MVRTSRSLDTLRNMKAIIVEKARQAIYTTKSKGCTTDKGLWYVSAVGRFYKRFLWNAKYEIVYG